MTGLPRAAPAAPAATATTATTTTTTATTTAAAIARVLTAAFLLALLTGCPGLTQPLEKPTVSFRGVALGSVGLSGITATAGFSIYNPNALGLPLRAVDWEFSVGGSAPVRGRVDLSETIPAKGTAPVDVTFRIGPATAVSMASRISSGARDYRLSGVLHFQTSLGQVAVNIDHSGSLGDLQR